MNDSVHIPGRDIVVLLLAEGKRKPNIQALIDNVQNLSDEDIATVKVPMKWYRTALTKLREKSQEAEVHLLTLQGMDGHVLDSVVGDPVGSVREWCSGVEFVEIERGQLELRDGSLAWFPDSGGVWIDTLFSNKIDPRFSSSRFLRRCTKSEYSTELRARRNKSHATENIPLTVVEGAPQSNPLFRIERI